MAPTVGILHPGEMGSFVAASLRNTLGQVYWCSEGRSQRSRERAEAQQLSEIPTLQEFCSRCELIVSVCPPGSAAEQAQQVADCGFTGLYLDANALAPASVQQLGEFCRARGMRFIDGGVVGLASYKPGTTWLYLSGPQAAEVAPCFAAGPIEVEVLGEEIGQASALKMCYAAWNKGKNALLEAVLASAEAMQVREALERQWERNEPGSSSKQQARLTAIARKAWRFGPEMEEIARTLADSQVPEGFFTAAAEVYRRQSAFKDCEQPPELAELLATISSPRPESA